MTTRVLVADDHPMIRTALDVLLKGTEFEIAGWASSGSEAIRTVGSLDPDILLLDVRMPDGTGIDVLRHFREQGDRRKIVLLTAEMTDPALMDAVHLKADGIVLKNADPAHLLDCLKTVATGRQWIDPELGDRATAAGAAAHTRIALAPRERELIGLVRRGLRNREIASELGVTEGTVKVYLHSIFDKTGVANRTELAMRADALIGPAN
jgi:two-component system, NarL family, nitrate/nitrite response regulator NarL